MHLFKERTSGITLLTARTAEKSTRGGRFWVLTGICVGWRRFGFTGFSIRSLHIESLWGACVLIGMVRSLLGGDFGIARARWLGLRCSLISRSSLRRRLGLYWWRIVGLRNWRSHGGCWLDRGRNWKLCRGGIDILTPHPRMVLDIEQGYTLVRIRH